MNPTGGLIYHYRALKYRESLWRDFRQNLGQWLEEWQVNSKKLLLIGPSGGYTLPEEWLRQFEVVDALDLDPLAPAFFKSFHRSIPVKWHRRSGFPMIQGVFDCNAMGELLDEFSDHAILFTNLLGQISILEATSPEEVIEQNFLKLRSILTDRCWASYHDRISGTRRPTIQRIGKRHLDDLSLVNQAYERQDVRHIESHATSLLGDSLDCRYIEWRILPTYWHTIEACHS